jgi:hypothetical protein
MKRTPTSLAKLGMPLTLSPMEAALVAEPPRNAEGLRPVCERALAGAKERYALARRFARDECVFSRDRRLTG